MKQYLGLIVIILYSPLTFSKNKALHIKVKVAKSQGQVLISGFNLNRYIWQKKSWKSYSDFKRIQFNCKSKSRVTYQKPIRLALISSNKGFVYINNKKYKGRFHIQTSERFNGCDVINEIPLEDYLASLLPKEMNSNWPIEALKAQAVAARSYAYYKVQTNQVSKIKGFVVNYHIESSERHQVSGSYDDTTKKTYQATKKTKGEILTFSKNSLIPIFFHSKCGGKTLTPEQVWQNKVPGYESVECPFCHGHGPKDWSRNYKKRYFAGSIEEVLRKYNRIKTKLKKHKYYVTESSHIEAYLEVNNEHKLRFIKKSRLRNVMGRLALPSNLFKVLDNGKTIQIKGAGFGHGVGMCQFGAKELALQGFSYKQILAYYFPELKLRKLY